MNSNDPVKNKRVIMVGPALDAMGGISAVVNVYKSSGLFERLPMQYLASHCDGAATAKLKIFARSITKFWALLVCGKVGLVHIHVSLRASFWRKAFFFFSAYIFRIPTILHLHSSQFPTFYQDECGPRRRALIRFVFNHAERVVVLSAMWKDWVNANFSNPHVMPVNNPVSLPEIVPPWESRSAERVLFLGRLGKNKGTYDLITAAATVFSRHPDLQLKLGGDGELDAARAFAAKSGIEKQVELLGWVRADEKASQLATSGIYALPSYSEGLPMSVLEAMAAGLPILSTPVGGIPEVVTDGVEGFLVAPGDVSALANRLEQLLSTPDLAKTMGAAARRKVASTYSAEVIVPQIETLYGEFGFRPSSATA